MVSKKKVVGTVSLAGEEQQGKSVVKDGKVSKKKSEFEEEKSRSNPSHSEVVKSSMREIDEIFGNKKRKVVVAEPNDSSVCAGATLEKKKKKKQVKAADAEMQRSSDRSASGSGGKPRKRTIDGYTIYSENEIGWNKNSAGGTPLCPFDCDCCF